MITRTIQTPIMHRAVEHQGVIYFGGVIAENLSQPMEGQAKEIFSKLDSLLETAGSSKDRILSAQIYLTAMTSKAEMNRAWAAWLDSKHLPVRATIGVSDLGPDVLIEVVVIAARG